MTNGASNDIERATDLARNMVCNWGMSDKLGPINYTRHGNSNIYSGEAPTQFSDETSRKIDIEIQNFVNTNYEVAKKLLNERMDTLHRLANALVVWETLDADQIRDIVAGKDIGQPVMTKKPAASAAGTSDSGPVFNAGKTAPA
jgi:cell division protease FtsH